MISLIAGATLVQSSGVYYELPVATPVVPRDSSFSDKIHAFFSEWRDEGYANSTLGPFCPASAHVLVDTRIMPMSDQYVKFLNKKVVEISIDEEAIATLSENVNRGNFPNEVMRNPELFPIALSAGAIGTINIDDVANLRIWQQLREDYGDSHTVEQLFDASGKGHPEVLTRLKSLDIKLIKKWRSLIRKLPKSQQTFISGLSGTPYKVFSLQAEQLLYQVKYGQHFNSQPRLGMKFSKNAVTNAEINDRARLVAIPPLGTTLLDAYPYNLISQFVDHDRQHVEGISRVRTSTVEAFLEIITAFRQVAQVQMSPEIWKLADFVNLTPRGDANEEFDRSWFELQMQSITLDWAAKLHIFKNTGRWLDQYGIVGEDAIGDKYYEVINESIGALEAYSTVEKIYLWQKRVQHLTDNWWLDSSDADAFYQRELPLPRLIIAKDLTIIPRTVQ